MNIPATRRIQEEAANRAPQVWGTPRSKIISLLALGTLSCVGIIYAAPFLAGAHTTILAVKILSSTLSLISFIAAAILYAKHQAQEEIPEDAKVTLERVFQKEAEAIQTQLTQDLKIVQEAFEKNPLVVAYKKTKIDLKQEPEIKSDALKELEKKLSTCKVNLNAQASRSIAELRRRHKQALNQQNIT